MESDDAANVQAKNGSMCCCCRMIQMEAESAATVWPRLFYWSLTGGRDWHVISLTSIGSSSSLSGFM